MATLEDLADEARVMLQIETLAESLASMRVRIAEIRDVNSGAVTYNLPNEPLSAIFEASLSLPPHVPDARKPKTQIPFEILVSSISRRWRNVAFHTPLLWTDIRINVSKRRENLIDLYLRRSKMCLLDITFKEDAQTGDPIECAVHTKNFECYFERLVPHAIRWRTFTIDEDVHVGALSKVLSPLSNLSVPALQKMRIHCIDGQPSLVQVFSGGAPLLSSLELRGTCVQPPNDNIRSLTLSQCPIGLKEFTQLMRPMRSLIHLSIYPKTVLTIPPSPIVLPSVISLAVGLERGYDLCNLNCLDLPALESLTIRGLDTKNVMVALARCHRLFPVLHSLQISYCGSDNFNPVPAAITRDFFPIFEISLFIMGLSSRSVMDSKAPSHSGQNYRWSPSSLRV